MFPPLAQSDYLNADPQKAIGVLLRGLTGKVTVNGKEFDSVMPELIGPLVIPVNPTDERGSDEGAGG